MVVKVYISGISGNKEVKKRQQRVLMILDSKNIKYEVIDITEPGRENDKDFMQNNAKSFGGTIGDPNPRSPLPPQVFNDEEYCGDYDQFDLANEVDTLEQFVKVEVPPEEPPQAEDAKAMNGDVSEDKNKESKENSQERDKADTENPDQITETEDNSPAEEDHVPKEGSPAKDGSVSREPTPVTEDAPSKEPSPPKESGDDITTKEDSPAKEAIVEKEKSPVKDTELETNKTSKENSPVKDESVNENGTFSSRDQSEEKDGVVEESKKDNPSEALIQSEQITSAE